MTILKSILSLLLLTAVSYALPDIIRFTEPIQILPYREHRTVFSDADLFPNARSCGGTGKFIKIGHGQCTSGGPNPCVVPHDGVGRTEMVFVPSADTTGLGVVTRIIADGDTKEFETLLPDVTVVAGDKYALTMAGGATTQLKRKHVITQVEVFRMLDRQVESCGEMESDVI